MNSDKKIKTLWVIIAVLVILNLITLGNMWFMDPKTDNRNEIVPRSNRQGNFIESRLGFDEAQANKYQELRQTYFDQVRTYYEEIRNQKEALYTSLKRNDVSRVDEITQNIGGLHAQIELLTFEHFSEVRQIGTEEQQLRFDTLMNRMVDRAVQPFPRQGNNHRERRQRFRQ